MNILELHVEGFRSLKNVTWKPGDLNVVIGPNGSGKSNLLKVLELMASVAEGSLEKYIHSSGGAVSVSWDGRLPQVNVRTVMAHRSDPFVKHRNDEPYLDYALSMGTDEDFGTWVQRETLTELRHAERGEAQGTTVLIDRGSDKATLVRHDNDTAEIKIPDELPHEEGVLSIARAPLIGAHSAVRLRREILKWYVYNSLDVGRNASTRQAQVVRYDRLVSPDADNLVNVLHTLYSSERTFRDKINSAMTAAFGSDFDELIFPPASDQRIQLRISWKSLHRAQSTADLSDGILRFLYLLAVLGTPDPPSLIAVDEPEIGLHPSMLPIIAEFAVAASKRTQIILTTHSAQLLDAFKVTDTVPTATVARWEDGETKLSTLDPADLEAWLKEYTLGDLFTSGTLEAIA